MIVLAPSDSSSWRSTRSTRLGSGIVAGRSGRVAGGKITAASPLYERSDLLSGHKPRTSRYKLDARRRPIKPQCALAPRTARPEPWKDVRNASTQQRRGAPQIQGGSAGTLPIGPCRGA